MTGETFYIACNLNFVTKNAINTKYISLNRNFLPDSTMFDAVMVYQRDVNKTDLPLNRSQQQIYVNFNLESPISEQQYVSIIAEIFKF